MYISIKQSNGRDTNVCFYCPDPSTELEGRRGKGRPRLRWIDDVVDDLRKLGVKRWRAKALDREEWASIISEAKAKLKGP
jgi:hypothetical protein